MSWFDALLVGHLIGDFLFQTSWMARYKATRWLPLTVHASVYTVLVALTSLFVRAVPWWGVAVIWLTHFIIDRLTLGAWWAKHVQRVARKEDAWLNIVADQILHILVLAAVTRLP